MAHLHLSWRFVTHAQAVVSRRRPFILVSAQDAYCWLLLLLAQAAAARTTGILCIYDMAWNLHVSLI